MVGLIPPTTVLTQASATNDLSAFGLEALGLAAPALSPVWAGADPAVADYDANALTLRLNAPAAPFRGIATWEQKPATLSDVSGRALAGPALVLRLHPEAARRLQTEIDLRLGTKIHPIPVTFALTGTTPPATIPPPQIYLARETLLGQPGSAVVSFHDARGLPIDPIAVAQLWADLLTFRPALQNTDPFPARPMDAGGVGNMLALANGVLVHVVDPHGWRYAAHGAGGQLHILNAAGDESSPFPASSLFVLDGNQRLGRTNSEAAAVPPGGFTPLRWGFARNATLGTAPLAPPPLPLGVTLGRRFLRVMAVDLAWHLLGNRTTAPVTDLVAGDVSGEDGATPAFLQPSVRDPVPGFAWLSNGADILGAMAQAVQGFGQPGDQLAAIAVSPAIDGNVTAPPSPGAGWPVFPPTAGAAQEIASTTDPRVGLAANWRNPADGPAAVQDVVLTLDPANLPLGAHVRAYPRRFVEIRAIGPQPSFVRGDGGAAVVQVASPVTILLVNPFALEPAEAHPTTPLTVDLVVVSRSGRRRIYSAVSLAVGNASQAIGDPGFMGLAPLGGAVAAILDGLGTRSIAPLPLFGLPRPPGDGNPPTSLKDLLRRLATDEQPRQGPRLPTQARFDSQFAVGTMPPGQTVFNWQAVASGIRFTPESRQTRPDLANAGNPAGPDLYAAGIACRGRLARDIAIHALKRAQPIFVPDTPTRFHGWIATLMDGKWGVPPADTAGTVAAVGLETIAAFCDTPELAAAPQPQPGASFQGLLNTIAAAFGVPPPTGTLGSEQAVVPAVQREIATARSGQRDALWSLTRAFSQARELIYIESPGFGRTARGEANPKPYQRDLADILSRQMTANPRLKLIVCVPREGDFDRSRPAWTITALDNRRRLLEDLVGVDKDRIAAFHPFGFPGRAPAIRTTTVIVDDVYCLTGTSHFRRRGMTFDGALDIANVDRAIAEGYSAGIADFRRRLMAEKLGLTNAASVAVATPLWLRLGTPEGAFDAIADLLATGGAGRLEPVWTGAKPDGILSKEDKFVDPDGVDGDAFLGLFASMIVED